jgi:hypothetical protein
MRMTLTRRRVSILLFLALLQFLIVGCYGWGTPTLVGQHRFEHLMRGAAIGVFDPPSLPAFLMSGSPDSVAGQFSPDGRWLYLIYAGGGSTSVSVVTLRQEAGVLKLDLQARAECNLSCGAFVGLGATRASVPSPVNPAAPPPVELDGEPILLEPWMP